MTPSRNRVNIHGIPVTGLDLPDLLVLILEFARSPRDQTKTIAYANAHSCNLAVEDRSYRAAMDKVDLVYLDGNGPRIAAWLAGDRLPPRLTGPDWMGELCRHAMREGLSLYLLGGRPGVAERAGRALTRRYRDLQIVGSRDGYFQPQESAEVIRRVNQAKPDITILGLGSPRQELWMMEHCRDLQTSVIWSAGGLLDYVSGHKHRPPRWLRSIGLEWLGRLLLEPRRLAPRYLIGIPLFTLRTLRYAFRRRFL